MHKIFLKRNHFFWSSQKCTTYYWSYILVNFIYEKVQKEQKCNEEHHSALRCSNKNVMSTEEIFVQMFMFWRGHGLIPRRRWQPDWWRQVEYSGTKLLYQPEPRPVVYIVPVRNILGRSWLALVPYGVHGTIPYDWHQVQSSHYPRGVCDRQGTPGSGSKLFYINSWAMIWSSDQTRTRRDGEWVHFCVSLT